MSSHFFDSHCHFDFDVFDQQRLDIWQQCQAKHIKQLMIPGVEPAQWKKSAEIANQYKGVVMSVGVHPWWVATTELPSLDQWQSAINHPLCVAIGECGLDAAIDTPMKQQCEVFEHHLGLAVDKNLPLIVHVRRTHNDTIRYLKRYRPAKGGVIHGFTGSEELAMEYWRMGFYIGVGGSISYPRANKTRTMVKNMPLEALVLETDAPDMPLHGQQGKANSPLFLPDIARVLAELRGDSVDTIAQQTTHNSQQLFQHSL